MKTLTITLPDELSAQQEHDLKMELTGTLHAKGLLSLAQAAQLVGIERREFMETMGRYGYSPLGTYTTTDLDEKTGWRKPRAFRPGSATCAAR